MTQSLVYSCTKSSFREVSRTHSSSGLSKSTIHALLQRVAESAIQGEKQEHRAYFGEGNISPPGRDKTPILYTEVDGIHIPLQREKDKHGKRRKHYELKNCIAYEGWERLPQTQERYRLVNKKVYCHGAPEIPFWDGAGLMFHRYWDLSDTKLVVLGGDDADWINDGMDAMGELGKWCGRSLPKPGRQRLSFDMFDSQHTVGGAIPALNGPHASRHWVRIIRQLTQHRLL